MSTDDPGYTTPSANKPSPYTEEWRGHKDLYFLKVGISMKDHEIDYALNVAAVDALSPQDKRDTAGLLQRLAEDFEEKAARDTEPA
jgi:hypothetical protein